MRIAVIGIRGIPATYGGLETCAQEVGTRLVSRGHEVIVYCRKGSYHHRTPQYKGIRRITLPSLNTKATDTYSHSLLCMFHVLFQKPDVILAFNPALATLCIIPKLFGYRIALNPDGFDWKREKWGRLARDFIHISARLCTKVVDQMIIDAVSVKEYFNQVFRCDPPAIYIPNGANPELPQDNEISSQTSADILKSYNLSKNEFILFLSRHVPENSCEFIIQGFENLKTDKKLFFAGGSQHGSAYETSLKQTRDPRIIFPGPIYDPIHVEVLHHNCFALVHGNQPGGTSLGLLKALGYGTCVMTLDTPDNSYVIKEAGLKYNLSPKSICETMQYLVDHPEDVVAFRRKAVDRVKEEYLWDVVTDRYEEVLSRLGHAT